MGRENLTAYLSTVASGMPAPLELLDADVKPAREASLSEGDDETDGGSLAGTDSPLHNGDLTSIRANVKRERGGWTVLISVPGGSLTARGETLAEVRRHSERIIADWAAETGNLEAPADDLPFHVEGETREIVRTVHSAQAIAEGAAVRARNIQIEAVKKLRARGLTMQDIADLMGVTKSRISQLANAR